MRLQDDYQVTLDLFKGPLDLLLYLIRRAEVDIHDIPIADITDQYLAFLRQIDQVDIDLAGEFLVMAATLIEIKSRTLMPAKGSCRRDGDDGADGRDDDDPRSELIQQLLAYQRYRIASEALEGRRAAFDQRFPAAAAVTRSHVSKEDEDEDGDNALPPVELELDDVSSYDLYTMYQRIIASIDMTRLGDHTVEVDDTPIALHQDDLLDRLERAPSLRMTLQDAFEGKTQGQRIGLFLAMLELVRTRRVTVEQDDIAAAIVLILNDDPDVAVPDVN